jgi:hypothetical protein
MTLFLFVCAMMVSVFVKRVIFVIFKNEYYNNFYEVAS